MATTGVNDPFSTDLFFLVLIIKLFLQYKCLTDVHTSGNRGLSEAFTCGVRLWKGSQTVRSWGGGGPDNRAGRWKLRRGLVRGLSRHQTVTPTAHYITLQDNPGNHQDLGALWLLLTVYTVAGFLKIKSENTNQQEGLISGDGLKTTPEKLKTFSHIAYLCTWHV